MAEGWKINKRTGEKILVEDTSSAWTIDLRTGELVLIEPDVAVSGEKVYAQIFG